MQRRPLLAGIRPDLFRRFPEAERAVARGDQLLERRQRALGVEAGRFLTWE
jgi:hypothetical protein